MKRDKTYTIEASRGLAAIYAKRALPTLWQTVMSQLVLEEPEGHEDLVEYWSRAGKALIGLRTKKFDNLLRRGLPYLHGDLKP